MQTIAATEQGSPTHRIGRFGITQPPRADFVIAAIAMFIATLDVMLIPVAILSFMRLG